MSYELMLELESTDITEVVELVGRGFILDDELSSNDDDAA